MSLSDLNNFLKTATPNVWNNLQTSLAALKTEQPEQQTLLWTPPVTPQSVDTIRGTTNFDANDFNPNTGKDDAYNTRWNNYINNLAKDNNKINVKKARKYFDSQFEQDWNNEETIRKLDFINNLNKLVASNLINKYRQQELDAQVASQELDALDYENAGYTFNAATGNWDAPVVTTTKPSEEHSMYWWLKEAQKVNPNFKSIEDVRNWQSNNNLTDDGKFGDKSKLKWDELHKGDGDPGILARPKDEDLTKVDWSKEAPINKVTKGSNSNPNNFTFNGKESYYSDWIKGLETAITNEYAKWYLNKYNSQIPNDFRNTLEFKDYHDWVKNLYTTNSNLKPINVFLTSSEMLSNGISNLFTPTYVKKHNIGGIINEFKNGGIINKFQLGGNMNNQEELQKAFMAFLIEDAKSLGMNIQSELDLLAYAEQLGEEGLKAKYQEFMQKMQGGLVAKLGAKLNYIKKLKGDCPEGEKLVYFKKGGRVCKACEKMLKGDVLTKKNAVEEFKEKNKRKKNIGYKGTKRSLNR